MISDVLSDAVAEIRGWQQTHPGYADDAQMIDSVTSLMDALRIVYDCCRPELTKNLRAAIAKVNVADVVNAQNELIRKVNDSATVRAALIQEQEPR
jgi:predicted RNA polymerase sigma factor